MMLTSLVMKRATTLVTWSDFFRSKEAFEERLGNMMKRMNILTTIHFLFITALINHCV